MTVKENWFSFVKWADAKAESHGKVAQSWDKVANTFAMIMILLTALTTIATLLPIPPLVSTIIGALATGISAIHGSLNPSYKRQEQLMASREFRTLKLKMLRVESVRDYEELWKDFRKELKVEPFLPSKFKVKDHTDFTMSSAFEIAVCSNEAEVKEKLENLGMKDPSGDSILSSNSVIVSNPVTDEKSAKDDVKAEIKSGKSEKKAENIAMKSI